MIKERELFTAKKKVLQHLNTQDVFTIDEVLEYFDISRIYLYKLIEFGKLPKPDGKVGRYRVYTQEQFNKILDSGLLNHRVSVT